VLNARMARPRNDGSRGLRTALRLFYRALHELDRLQAVRIALDQSHIPLLRSKRAFQTKEREKRTGGSNNVGRCARRCC